MMPTLSSIMAPEVGVMTTCGATNDVSVGIMAILCLVVSIFSRLRKQGQPMREDVTHVTFLLIGYDITKTQK